MMYPKHQYVRSKKLMEAYRKIECHRCGKQWTVPCNFDEDYS